MMTAKEYFRQARHLDLRINSHIREKERLRQLACSVSSPRLEADKVQTSPSGEAPYVRILMKVMDMEETIDQEIDQLVDLKEQMAAVINSLADPDECVALRLHYIDQLSISVVADEMRIAPATVKRKIRSA